MRDIKIAHLVSTFGIGLFAGLLYTFQQGVIPMLNTLNASEYAKAEQGLIRSLDAFPTGVIVVAIISMFLPLYPLIRLWSKRNTAYWRFTAIAWIIFFLGVGVVTIVFNAPINQYVLTWNIDSPPADWEAARTNWNNFNSIRTPLNLLSFLLMIWAAVVLPASTER